MNGSMNTPTVPGEPEPDCPTGPIDPDEEGPEVPAYRSPGEPIHDPNIPPHKDPHRGV